MVFPPFFHASPRLPDRDAGYPGGFYLPYFLLLVWSPIHPSNPTKLKITMNSTKTNSASAKSHEFIAISPIKMVTTLSLVFVAN